MLKVSPSHLDEQQCDSIELISRDHKCHDCDIVIKHDIDVKEAKPIKQHPYRINPTKRALMKAEIEYLLLHGLAMHSSSS